MIDIYFRCSLAVPQFAVAVVLFTTFVFHSSRQSTSTTRRTNSLDLEQEIKTRESIKIYFTQFLRFICLASEVFKSTHRFSFALANTWSFKYYREKRKI
jgi:hypothetical protein